MSDSDAEFEKFLQESLSSSAASYQSFLSELSRSRAGGASPRSLKPWWNECSTSDQEIEAAGQSWLKSSAHSGTGRAILELTLPTVPEGRRVQDTSIDQSRDSLEESKTAVSKENSKHSGNARFKSNHNTVDDSTSMLEHSGHFSQAGPDTLEENFDKQHFFVELEQDRESPIDYSELNRQLGDTGLSSLTPGTVADQDNLQDALKSATADQDLNVTPKHSDAHHCGDQEIGPTIGSSQAKASISEQHGFDLSTIHEPTSTTRKVRPSEDELMPSPVHKFTDLTASGPSVKSSVVSRPLHTTMAVTTDDFSLSTFHAKDASRHLNTSGSSCKSGSTSHHSGTQECLKEQCFTLSPIRTVLEPKASEQFKSSIKPLAKLPSSAVHQAHDVSLSPIHAKRPMTTKLTKESEIQTKLNIPEPEALTLSPIHIAQTKKKGSRLHIHTEQSAETHQQQSIHMPSAEVPPSLSFMSSGTHTGGGTDHEESLNQMVEVDKKVPSKKEENNTLAVGVSGSGLKTDLAELQSALRAAGMPKLTTSTSVVLQSPENHSSHKVTSTKVTNIRGSSSGHAEDSYFRGLNAQQTVRAIATEELASLTKEIILQDLETGMKDESLSAHLEIPSSHASGDALPVIHDDDLTGEQVGAKPASGLNEGLSTGNSTYSSMKKPVAETQNSESSQKNQKESRKINGSTQCGQSPTVFERVKPKQLTNNSPAKKSTTQSVKRKLVPSSHSPKHPKLASNSLRHSGLKLPPSTKTASNSNRTIKSRSKGSFGQNRYATTTGAVEWKEKASGNSKSSTLQESASTEVFTGLLQSKDTSAVLEPLPEHVQQTLQEEILKWQKACQEKKIQCNGLKVQLEMKERELSLLEERLRVKYDKEQQELRQEIFTLNAKMSDFESSQDHRRLAASGKPIPEEERATLQKDIQEQEALLQGYQKENERLYNEVTEAQKELKAVRAQMYKENHKLVTELVNTKSQLERQSHQAHRPHGETAARVTQLEGELQHSQHVCRGLEEQVGQLQKVKQYLEQEVESLRMANQVAEAKQVNGATKEELQQIKDKHKEEVSALMQQLKWYAENQKLLDQDYTLLTGKEKEMADLKEKLASLEPSEMKQRVTRDRAASAKKIRDLEQHVKALESVIQKRFPNSLSALILASTATESDKSGVQGGAGKGTAAATHLERRVHQLEKQLENKDQESARRIRALQQKYTAMELLYEQQLSTLKEQLQCAVADTSAFGQQVGVTKAHPHTTVLALEHELSSVRQKQQARISQLEREVERLREDNRKLKRTKESSGSDVAKKKHKDSEHLASKTQVADHPGSSEPQIQDKTSFPRQEHEAQDQGQVYMATEWQSKELEAAAYENHQLREQLCQLQFELAHQRVQLQGKLAQAEGKTRQIQEDMMEKLASLQLEHRQKVDELVGRFTNEYSQSEVTRLQSKVAALEATVTHLRDLLQTSCMDSELLVASKSQQERLTQQVQSLSQELVEARKYHTPEMHHFSMLQAKINSLETRTLEYESWMSHLLQKPSKEKLKEMKRHWQKQIQTKSAEIEGFREDLDSILSTLHVLEQGAVTL